jgi:hypothetical protein
VTTRGRLWGAVAALAGGSALGLTVHSLGDASFRPLPLLEEVAAGVAIGLVVWIGALVLRREAP